MIIGLITDIHEDYRGLEQSLRVCGQYRCEAVACLGDIVGYHPDYQSMIKARDASRCVELVRSHCRWVTAGNHDLNAVANRSVSGIWLERENRFHALPQDLAGEMLLRPRWNYDGELPHALGDDALDYLRGLPAGIVPDFREMSCLFSHYVFPDLNGAGATYIRRRSDLGPLRALMESLNLQAALTGHTHLPGAGFAFPGKISGLRRFLKAVHHLPFGTYPLGGTTTLCLLPAVAADTGASGLAVLDTGAGIIHIVSIDK